MLRFSGFMKNVSIVLLTVALLVVYAFLGKEAGVLFDKNGNQVFTLTKNQFFYYSFFTALVFNLIFQIFTVYLKKGRKSAVQENTAELRKSLIIWWQFLVMSVNLFFTCFLIFAGLANNAENYSFESVTFIPVVGIGPLIVTLLVLPFLYYYILKNFRKNPA